MASDVMRVRLHLRQIRVVEVLLGVFAGGSGLGS